MRLPVPQIPWGRSNQFGDLMRVLKFRAVHFDYRAGISKEDLRCSLDNARLAGAGGPQEQQVSDWAPRRAQPGTEHLIELDKRLHGLVLPHDLLLQRILKMARRRTPLSRVQLFPVGRLRCCCHNVSFTVLLPFSRDPLTDVCWTIPELEAVRFPAPKETDSAFIHEG